MSGRQNFNRTRNNTMHPPTWGTNTSNGSYFGSNTSNDSRFGGGSFDESPKVMFYLLTTLVIPSMICFLFLFYNFIHLPQLRTKSTNLLIICLLIINFVHMLADLPNRLYFLFENQVPFFHSIFCLLWTWYDNILTTVDLFIMAFISIERYLSVFHHIFLHNHKRLFCPLPIAICFAIPIIWYTFLIFGYPCENFFMYSTFQCGVLCYLTSSQVFVNVENFVFFMFPLFIIVVGNSTLIISVLIQKARMKRKHRLGLWKNNLRMISQLTVIAVLYMSIYVPSCILLIFGSYVHRSRFQPLAASLRTRYFIHLKYMVIFGCPFVVLFGQKEMHQTIKNVFLYVRRQQPVRWKTHIYPMTVMNTRNRKEQK